MLQRIDRISEQAGEISLGLIIESVGSRSFGPLLLIPGLLLVSPLSGIPGMATLMGIFVVLVAAQILVRPRGLWIPRWLLARSMPGARISAAVDHLLPIARWIDRWIAPRLPVLVGNPGMYFVAAVCLVVGLFMPLMELVPFSASSAGAVLVLFGLALLSRDGLLALLGHILTGGVIALIAMSLV